jgi:hypothetical protein
MSVNRKRNVQIIIRLTEEEQELLLQRMRDVGIQNREAYLRNMALTGYILRLDMSEVHEALRLMANAANNINRIYADDMIQLREEVGELRLQVSDVMKVFAKVRQMQNL